MNNENFLIIGDEAYFDPLKISVTEINKFHPGASIYIYNWGLTKNQINRLSEHTNVHIIQWELKLIDYPLSISKWQTVKRILGAETTKGLFYNLLKNRKAILNAGNLFNTIIFEQKIYNKFLVIRDMSQKTRENFVFLDADAFLINPVPEFFSADYSLGLTVRPKLEWSWEYNNCQILNAGVIIFSGGHKNNSKILNAWHNELENTRELYCEQTSLTRLLHKSKKDIFENIKSTQNITVGKHSVKIRIYPCETHNFNWIEKFDVDKHINSVKILHFKSKRFQTQLFKDLANKLKICTNKQ